MLQKLENAKRLYLLKLKQKLPKFKRYIYTDLIHTTSKLTEEEGGRSFTFNFLQHQNNSPFNVTV